MKVLFFADLHGDMKQLGKLRNKAKDADVVVSAGDISSMEDNLSRIVHACNDFGKPFIMIHGNHEDKDRLRKLCASHENLIFLHKGVHHVENFVFLGYGGDGFSTKDAEFEKVAGSFFKPEALTKERIIFITHGPPHGTTIDKIGESHRGNKSYRAFIDEIRPHVAVAGHLHETAGKYQKLGRTLLMNPGKQGMLVNFE